MAMGDDKVDAMVATGAEVLTVGRHVMPDAPRRPAVPARLADPGHAPRRDPRRGRRRVTDHGPPPDRCASRRRRSPARRRSRRGREAALADDQLRANLGRATATIRDKRARAVGEVADWEQLRLAGAAIKDDGLADLPELLDAAGGARSPRPAGSSTGRATRPRRTRSSPASCSAAGADEVVKVKSMATQEIELNEALADAGYRRLGDRPRGADRPAGPRPALAHPRARDPPQPLRDPGDLPARDGGGRPARPGRPDRRAAAPWPRRPGCICARSSCAPRWPSPARTSRSPRPGRSWSSSPRATAGCA